MSHVDKKTILNKGLLCFVVPWKQFSKTEAEVGKLNCEFQKRGNSGGTTTRMFNIQPEDSVFLNPTLWFLGVFRSAVSAQSGPNEERWLWERAPRAPHQDRQRAGKG